MARYRVRPGFRFGAYDQHGPGTVVELTEAEAAGFRDKLELVVEVALPQEDVPSDPSDILADPLDVPSDPPAPEPPKGKKRS